MCGCILDEELHTKHVVTDDDKVVALMSDSKYVQSDMGDCYLTIAELLNQDKPILFSGTSCQTHALLLFLQCRKQDTSKLLCLDIVCHGVPSPMIFADYLKFYEETRNCRIYDFKFRSKKYGWGDRSIANNYIQAITTDKGIDDRSFIARLWMNIFFSDLVTRECCFNCPYTSTDKPADITLGDFWGISRQMPEMDDTKGTSLVLCRTSAGRKRLDDIDVKKKKCEDVTKAIFAQSRLKKPCVRPKEYDNFWTDYGKEKFCSLCGKYFRYSCMNTIKYRIKMVFYSMGLNSVANRIFNDILI